MKQRKYDVDDNYFDTIDTEQKAYFFGLLYADGCNYENTGIIKIDLIDSDIGILEQLKKAIHSTYDIKIYHNGVKKIGEFVSQCQDTARLQIYSKHMSRQLALKGCVNNKSLIAKFPDSNVLPTELYNHFIRGYFDGNGSLSYWEDNARTGHKKFNLGFCGATEIINSIVDILSEKFSCAKTIHSRFPDRNNNNVQNDICGNPQIKNIMDWLYKDSTVYLERKYNKYIELCNEVRRVKNDNTLYGNAYPRKSVIRLNDLKIYNTLNGAAKDNGVHGSTMHKYCHNHNGFMYLDEYQAS